MQCLHENNRVCDWLILKPQTAGIGQGIWNVYTHACDYYNNNIICDSITLD